MYEQFYGLKSAPFRLSPDPEFFFGSQGHNRALAYLRYGLSQKEGFIVITGAPGTGKTTLARSLLKEIARDKVVVAELNTTHLEADDVLRMVAASFKLSFEDLPKATLLKRIESFCISRYRAGYHVLLLVDEAQNLPYDSLEELRMLSNFYLGKDALLQIFLLGQEQFRNTLYTTEMEQLRQRVVASSHLDPLNNEETREYIEHRLTLAGWTDSPKITDRAFVRIYSLTRGVPRRINTFCERLMLYGSLEGITEFHDDTVKIVAKELMYEVSAKGVKLSDIKPGVPGLQAEEDNADHAADAESEDHPKEENKGILDSDMLNAFSDEVPETQEVSEKQEAEPTAEDNAFESNVSEKNVNENSADEDSVVEDTTVIDDEFIDTSDERVCEVNVGKGDAKQAENKSSEKVKKRKSNTDKPKANKPQHAQPLRIVSNGNTAESIDVTHQTEYPVVDTKPVWWDLVALAADYYRQPTQFKTITSSKTPIPDGVSDSFKIAIGKMRVPEYLRTDELDGLTDQDIRDALRYYIKNVLLSNTADYYRRLGVSSDASFEQVRTHYKYLFRLFQPDKEQNASNWDETYTRRINQAYGTLRSTEKRKEYDDFLSALLSRNKKQQEKDADVIAGPAVEATAQVHTNAVSNTGSGGNQSSFSMGLIVGGLILVVILAVLFMFRSEIVAKLDLNDVAPFSSSFSSTSAVDVSEEKVAVNVFSPSEKLADNRNNELTQQTRVEIADVQVNAPQVSVTQFIVAQPETIIIEKPLIVAKVPAAKPLISKSVVKPVEKPAPKPVILKQEPQKQIATQKIINKKPVEPAKPVAVKKIAPVIKTVPAPVVAPPKPKATFTKNTSTAGSTKTKTTRITQKRLNRFITNFSLAYEEGDLDAFMTFFAKNASTNDAHTRVAIREDYKKLFSVTEMRVIDLDNLSWKIKVKKQKAVGKGEFTITVLGVGAEQMKQFAGLIKLDVIEVNNKLKLKGMFHAYGDGE